MTTKEAVNRGNNLVSTAIVSIVGYSFLGEVIAEKGWLNKADDLFMVGLGIAATVWYRYGKNSVSRSFVPTMFVLTALVGKIIGTAVEYWNRQDVADDLGAIALFSLASVLTVRMYLSTLENEKSNPGSLLGWLSRILLVPANQKRT